MKLKNILLVYTHPAFGEYKSTLDLVKSVLKKYGVNYNLADRDKLKKEQFLGKDLIIAIGGDGTFLRAAHFVDNEVLFGVNADVNNKEGFFMEGNKKNFESKVKKIINNEIIIKKLIRLECSINNRKIPALALNEFYIGPKKAYHSAKYIIQFGGIRERHKSSGVLVTTPAGSYAWASSCLVKKMPLDSRNFQFVVREPYRGKIFKNYRLKSGVLDRNQKIRIVSEMLDGVIVADSVGKEFEFKNSSEAAIKISKNLVNLLATK